jgi:pyruvate phosphate dikinase (EC 2.7.9.1)
MFNGADRIGLFVDMIMAENIEERKKVLKKIRVNYKKVISLKF